MAYSKEYTTEHTKWGYTFTWTENHLPQQETEPMRQQYDELGAAALDKLLAIKATRRAAMEETTEGPEISKTEDLDLYSILRDHHSEDELLTRFWDEVHSVPDWVDWDQIARGQRFFYRYAIANIVGFALQGFIGENSGASGVVEVLVRTGGFSTRVLWGRLLETFQWLLQVTHDLSSIQPGGEGHISTIRVRLLHASVRQRILRLVSQRPDYFSVEKYGVPVNTLDSVHSISTFCCNPMWLQLPKLGIRPRPDEIEDYIALFRYVAYLLATPTSYFASAEKAKATMESLFLHELRLTETSKIVAHNFVHCVETRLPPPLGISREFVEAGGRWMNGHELCDGLELGRPGILPYVLFSGQCALSLGLAWAQRAIPKLDEFMIDYFRTQLYWAVVQSHAGLKGGTKFDFKYKPQFGKKTTREDQPVGEDDGTTRGRIGLLMPTSARLRPVESVLFLVVCGIVGAFLAGGVVVFLVGQRWSQFIYV